MTVESEDLRWERLAPWILGWDPLDDPDTALRHWADGLHAAAELDPHVLWRPRLSTPSPPPPATASTSRNAARGARSPHTRTFDPMDPRVTYLTSRSLLEE
ncbi:hypothetical protein GCM10023094_54800 [Rhodococcus olei]|uniref:Uncharacterized protein n=1 Tax=Rhodococcus olei TaxID=2161675 RepID=A0ABP8PSI3_9NOCA